MNPQPPTTQPRTNDRRARTATALRRPEKRAWVCATAYFAAGASAPGLLELPGSGAVTAAKLLAEIGPIDRF
jgi:transposase